jgi:hypothetical protein
MDSEVAVDSEIYVYGAAWCGLTFRVREYLMNAPLAHEFFDIERDAKAGQFVVEATGGRFPTVVIDRQVITDPTIAELQRVLTAHAILPRPRLSRQGARPEAFRHG